MQILKSLSAAFVASVLAISSTPAVAQQQAPERPQIITQFDQLMVTYLLQDVQATWTVETDAQGNTNYRASAEGGINFTLAPRACSEQSGCLGMMMLAVFTGVNAPSMTELDAFLNRLNDTSGTIKVFRNAQGVVVLQEYMNAAGGISYRNAQAQLYVFGEDIVAVSRALAQFERGG